MLIFYIMVPLPIVVAGTLYALWGKWPAALPAGVVATPSRPGEWLYDFLFFLVLTSQGLRP